MKSQREVKVRRLAVFVGYGDAEMGTSWSSRPDRKLRGIDEAPRDPTGPVEREPENIVIQFDAVPSAARLQHAA